MANSKRKCPHCGSYNRVDDGVLINNRLFCSFDHATAYAADNRLKGKAVLEKQHRKEAKEKKEKLKSRADHLKEAQQAFNAYIRARDEKLPCISCGRHHQGQYHAGHYLTVGAHPEMRFDEKNCHKQCSACNLHLSGNIINYRKNLILRYGEEIVDYLESHHPQTKLTIEDIKEIKIKYKNLKKEILKGLQG